MGTEKPAPPTTAAGRPTPTNQLSPQELREALDASPTQPLGPAAARAGADWPEGHTTGAFVSRAASFRYEVAEYRWGQVLWSVLLLYVVAVGLPVVGGIWAGVVIWNRMHHG